MSLSKLSYTEQLELEYRRSLKAGNRLRSMYYAQKMGTTSACVSYETFQKTWAYEEWVRKQLA